MNVNVPHFEVYVRESYLIPGSKASCLGLVFGAASIPGRAVGFHVMLCNGAQVGRLPVSALYLKNGKGTVKERETHQLELWDCPGYQMEAVEYDFLAGMRAETKLRDGSVCPGTYMFTLDWSGDQVSEGVGDLGWKCAHVLALDEGNVALQPNNRIRWSTPAWGSPFEWKSPPKYRTIDRVWTCEKHNKWTAGKGDEMFFEATEG